MGFEIGQKRPEAVMHSWGSYFVHVPYAGAGEGDVLGKFRKFGVSFICHLAGREGGAFLTKAQYVRPQVKHATPQLNKLAPEE